MERPCLPGKPFPWAPPGTEPALILRFIRNTQPRWNCVCTTTAAGAKASAFTARADGVRLALAMFPACSPASFTAIASRPLGAGARAALQSRQALIDPYAKAIAGSIDWEQADLSLSIRAATMPIMASTGATAPPVCPRAVVVNPYFDWEHDRPPQHPAQRFRHLRDACARLQQAERADSAKSCAALTRDWRRLRR